MKAKPVRIALEGELTLGTIDIFRRELWAALDISQEALGDGAFIRIATSATTLVSGPAVVGGEGTGSGGGGGTPPPPEALRSGVVLSGGGALSGGGSLSPFATPSSASISGGYGSAPRIVLDLYAVPIITTPGIGLLLELNREIVGRSGRLVISRPSAMIRDVIRRTQLGRVFTTAESTEAAEAELGK